jgi:hypothetical protein
MKMNGLSRRIYSGHKRDPQRAETLRVRAHANGGSNVGLVGTRGLAL